MGLLRNCTFWTHGPAAFRKATMLKKNQCSSVTNSTQTKNNNIQNNKRGELGETWVKFLVKSFIFAEAISTTGLP